MTSPLPWKMSPLLCKMCPLLWKMCLASPGDRSAPRCRPRRSGHKAASEINTSRLVLNDGMRRLVGDGNASTAYRAPLKQRLIFAFTSIEDQYSISSRPCTPLPRKSGSVEGGGSSTINSSSGSSSLLSPQLYLAGITDLKEPVRRDLVLLMSVAKQISSAEWVLAAATLLRDSETIRRVIEASSASYTAEVDDCDGANGRSSSIDATAKDFGVVSTVLQPPRVDSSLPDPGTFRKSTANLNGVCSPSIKTGTASPRPPPAAPSGISHAVFTAVLDILKAELGGPNWSEALNWAAAVIGSASGSPSRFPPNRPSGNTPICGSCQP